MNNLIRSAPSKPNTVEQIRAALALLHDSSELQTAITTKQLQLAGEIAEAQGLSTNAGTLGYNFFQWLTNLRTIKPGDRVWLRGDKGNWKGGWCTVKHVIASNLFDTGVAICTEQDEHNPKDASWFRDYEVKQ